MTNENAPERVWLQVWCGENPADMNAQERQVSVDDATWCADQINEDDIEYIRADLVEKMIEDAKEKDAIARRWAELKGETG